jgi:UDP-glucose 4-epimerase
MRALLLALLLCPPLEAVVARVGVVRQESRAATDAPPGIYNVAGDGTMGIDDLSRSLGKPVLWLPAWLLKGALGLARPLRLSRYGPEQVRFLQYRPVLDNSKLKTVFGYIPEKSSAETFALWQKAAGL